MWRRLRWCADLLFIVVRLCFRKLRNTLEGQVASAHFRHAGAHAVVLTPRADVLKRRPRRGKERAFPIVLTQRASGYLRARALRKQGIPPGRNFSRAVSMKSRQRLNPRRDRHRLVIIGLCWEAFSGPEMITRRRRRRHADFSESPPVSQLPDRYRSSRARHGAPPVGRGAAAVSGKATPAIGGAYNADCAAASPPERAVGDLCSRRIHGRQRCHPPLNAAGASSGADRDTAGAALGEVVRVDPMLREPVGQDCDRGARRWTRTFGEGPVPPRCSAAICHRQHHPRRLLRETGSNPYTSAARGSRRVTWRASCRATPASAAWSRRI